MDHVARRTVWMGVAGALLLGLAGATSAFAQPSHRIPPVALDARIVWATLGGDAITARDLNVAAGALPTHAPGLSFGLTFYPVRRGSVALGLGGDLLLAHASKTPDDDDDPATPIGATIRRRLVALSPQVSLNFGHLEGWSYLTAGMSPMLFQSYAGDAPPADPIRKMTINMGGGARWFNARHVAITFDIRFYLSRPTEIVGLNPGRERHRLLVMSFGVSFK